MNFDKFTPEGVVFFIPRIFEDQDFEKPLKAKFYPIY